MVIRFEFREDAHSLTLGDIPLLVGLVFTDPGHLLLAVVLGLVVARTQFVRRQSADKGRSSTSWCRPSPLWSPWSAYHDVLGHAQPASLRGWLAILVATTTVHLLSGASVLAVIAMSVGRPERGTIAPLLATTGVVTAINAALGIVAILVISSNPLGLLLFVGIGIVFGIGYREHTTLRRRHSELDQLYHFSRALAELVEADDVVAKVLTEAEGPPALRGGRAHHAHPEGRAVPRRLGARAEVDPDAGSPGPDNLQTLVERLNHGICVSQDRPPRRPRPRPSAPAAFADAMVAPVPGRGRRRRRYSSSPTGSATRRLLRRATFSSSRPWPPTRAW